MSLPACLPNKAVKVRNLHICRLRHLDRDKYMEVISAALNWQYTVQFLDGQDWEKIQGLTEATYQRTDDDGAHGTLYTHTAQGLQAFAKTSNAWATSLLNEDMLIKITADDGQEYLMGTLDQPVRFISNVNISSSSGIQLTFSCQGRHPLYSYDPVYSL